MEIYDIRFSIYARLDEAPPAGRGGAVISGPLQEALELAKERLGRIGPAAASRGTNGCKSLKMGSNGANRRKFSRAKLKVQDGSESGLGPSVAIDAKNRRRMEESGKWGRKMMTNERCNRLGTGEFMIFDSKCVLEPVRDDWSSLLLPAPGKSGLNRVETFCAGAKNGALTDEQFRVTAEDKNAATGRAGHAKQKRIRYAKEPASAMGHPTC